MTAAIVQARLSSQRFPRKILADVHGRTMLERVIEAAKRIWDLNAVIVAVPVDEYDAIRSRTHESCLWWGGPREDVLARYYGAAARYGVTTIMRLTADCPLLDPGACSVVLQAFRAGTVDYASNIGPTTDGHDCEVFSWAALDQAMVKAVGPEREHVTPWMRAHLRCLDVPVGAIPHKLSVDTQEDLDVVRAAWEQVPA